MRSFILIQTFLLCLSTFGKLSAYTVPGFFAQYALWLYSFFSYRELRVLSAVLLAVSALLTGFLLIVSGVRLFRFLFFPIKEDFQFALECALRLPLHGAQALLILFQGRHLIKGRDEFSGPALFQKCVYILFVHDFAYAAVLASESTGLAALALTQFVTHAMLLRFRVKYLVVFRVIFGALLLQHVAVMWALWDSEFVRVFTAVNFVATSMYMVISMRIERGKSKQ